MDSIIENTWKCYCSHLEMLLKKNPVIQGIPSWRTVCIPVYLSAQPQEKNILKRPEQKVHAQMEELERGGMYSV